MKLPNPLKHWKILLLMAGIFLAGLVCGGVLTASALGKAVVRALSMEGWSQRTTRDLQHHLRLSPEQTEKVKAIADRYQPDVMSLRDETFRRFGALQKQFHAEVLPLLTADQANTFTNLNKRRQEKFQKAFKYPARTNAESAGGDAAPVRESPR